jgi:hypothetical protein
MCLTDPAEKQQFHLFKVESRQSKRILDNLTTPSFQEKAMKASKIYAVVRGSARADQAWL